MTARSPQRQRLQDLLAPVVTATGYELVDVSVSAAGRRSLVRVTVDGDAGIDLDAVADVSRVVSEALDDNDGAFAGPFVLEVSSPGVDRPLTEPRLWRRALGRLVSVTLGDNGEPSVGRVRELDQDGVTLEIDGTTSHYPWGQVGTGRVQVEFNRPGSAPGAADELVGDEPDADEPDADEPDDVVYDLASDYQDEED